MKSLATLLLACSDVPRVTALTRDWVHDLMTHVAAFIYDQSGMREDKKLEFRVFDWFTLPITVRDWHEKGAEVGDTVVPMVEEGLGIKLTPDYEYFALVIDEPSSSAAAWRTNKYLHVAALDLTPALLAHEVGHMYKLPHANRFDITEPVQYGNEYCIMGGEGTKFSFAGDFDFKLPQAYRNWKICRKCRMLFDSTAPSHPFECPADIFPHAPSGDEQHWLTADPASSVAQRDWRRCKNCRVLFFEGFDGGLCPATNKPHEAAGTNFALRHYPILENYQSEWRFCGKCKGLYYNGFQPNESCCPSDKKPHDAVGFTFLLHHGEVPEKPAQPDWRFCKKCHGIFFDGLKPNESVCSKGGTHHASGFSFKLPHREPTPHGKRGDWRYCMKCCSLFFSGSDPRGMECAQDGGFHSAAGLNFELTINSEMAVGVQTGWRQCKKCRVLFAGGFEPDITRCPVDNQKHEAADTNFALQFGSASGSGFQDKWRQCKRCQGLYYDGNKPNDSACPQGGNHTSDGFNFILFHGAPPPRNAQSDWRYCDKCRGLFWNGETINNSHCPAGGRHRAVGWTFELRHQPSYVQSEEGWRYCRKCDGLFFSGHEDKGVCPKGGGHESAGVEFVLQSPLIDHSADGPGICAPGLSKAWLDVNNTNIGVDIGQTLRKRPGDVRIELKALNGAPPEDWAGPPVVAWADGLHSERLTIEYRSPKTYWDQGLVDKGAQVGDLGSIVVHLAGTPPQVSATKIAAFPAEAEGNFFLEQVGVKVEVFEVDSVRGTVGLQLWSYPMEPYLGQANWRWCRNCHALFYDGFHTKGCCPGHPAGDGEHMAALNNLVLEHDLQAPGNKQGQWRYCENCCALFYDGSEVGPGPCKCGGSHKPTGFEFFLAHTSSSPGSNHQGEWRYCSKCQLLFRSAGSESNGVCQAGGEHEDPGTNYYLPYR